MNVLLMRDLTDAYEGGPKRAAGFCSDCFGFGVCELITRDFFVAGYLLQGWRVRSGEKNDLKWCVTGG